MHLMVILRDITGRKKAEQELQQHREHLEELVAERTAELERLLYCIEVTERKAAEEWLDSSVEQGTLGAAEPEEARITTDAAGTVIIVSREAELLTGYAGEELNGKPVWDLFSGDARPHLTGEVLEQGRPVECAEGTALVKNDGSEQAVRIAADPIIDAAGVVIGMVCTILKA